jgi:CBS domain-containing protein
MQIKGRAQKVTIYIGESDKWKNKPLYMAILEMLKAEDCAGATVTRGLAGFGAHSRIHTASLVALSADLPLVIEWVDSPARVEQVMPRLQEMVIEGLITVQELEVVVYTHRQLHQLPANLPVRDIMSREVQTVQANTPLLEVIELLLDKGYRALPVVDEAGRVVGIVTEGDLLRKVNLLAASAQQQLTRAEMAAELRHLRRIDQTAARVMVPDPITVTGDVTLAQAIKLMVEHTIKRLPVVDDEHKLQGIVTRVDVLRAFSRPPVAELARRAPPSGHHSQVGEIMITDVPTVPVNGSLAEIVSLLVTNALRRVVIVDDRRRVVGIVTDGDLIKRATSTERSGIIQALSRRMAPEQTDKLLLSQRAAAEVMTRPVITVTPETPLSEALQLLLQHQIKRLPVVDAAERLVGLVGRGGILREIGRSGELNSPVM